MNVFKKHPLYSIILAGAIAVDICEHTWGWLGLHGAIAIVLTVFVHQNWLKEIAEKKAAAERQTMILGWFPEYKSIDGGLIFTIGAPPRRERTFILNPDGTLILPSELTQEKALECLWLVLKPADGKMKTHKTPQPPLKGSTV